MRLAVAARTVVDAMSGPGAARRRARNGPEIDADGGGLHVGQTVDGLLVARSPLGANPYPGSEGAPDVFFLRCMSCGFENHNGTSVRPTGAGL